MPAGHSPRPGSRSSDRLKPTAPGDATTLLLHSSGEMDRRRPDPERAAEHPQAVRSAITYGCRYGLAAMVGIAPEDDDGEAAEGRGPAPAARQTPAPPLRGWRRPSSSPRASSRGGRPPGGRRQRAPRSEQAWKKSPRPPALSRGRVCGRLGDGEGEGAEGGGLAPFATSIDGAGVIANRDLAYDLVETFRSFRGQHVDITIERHQDTRTQRQNAYLWGHVRGHGRYTGHRAEDIHDAMCQRFLPTTRSGSSFSPSDGEVLEVETDLRRSSRLTDQPSQTLSIGRLFAAEFLRSETEDPIRLLEGAGHAGAVNGGTMTVAIHLGNRRVIRGS